MFAAQYHWKRALCTDKRWERATLLCNVQMVILIYNNSGKHVLPYSYGNLSVQ